MLLSEFNRTFHCEGHKYFRSIDCIDDLKIPRNHKRQEISTGL
jgi:hypothetical protein